MIDPTQSVFIEYCHNCGQHSWCTKHDEARYYSLFSLIKTKIEEEFPGLTAYGNTHPAIGRPINPTLGAFEVTFNKHRIFSKLKTRTWPTTKQILASIRSVLDGQSPTGAELIDYNAIPYGDKAKTVTALPSARRGVASRTYLQGDFGSRSLSRNELETISCHSPGLVKTPRKIAASSLGRVDTANSTARPATSNYMPSLKSTFSQRPPTTGNNNQVNYLTANDFKNKPYYLQDGRRKSIEGDQLPDIKPSIVIGMATNNSYLNVSENPYEDAPSHRSFVDVPNILVSPKVASISNGLFPNQEGYLDPEDRQSLSAGMTQKRHVRSYSQDVTIKQTRDLENNEYTVFTQQKLQEERESSANYRSSPARKMFKRATWFPDCQRGNSSPERFVKGVNFEEALKPFTNLRRPDSGKRDNEPTPTKSTKEVPVKGKGSSSYSTMMTKTLANLKKLEFSEEKLSQIEVPRNKVSKKKITFVPDTYRPCKMEVYCTIPGVVGPEFAGVSVPKGATFKIPLKFEGKEVRDCWIYVMKDGRPYQKIIMDIYLV